MKYNEEDAWRQHFPTYHFKDKEVALEEYRLASKALESDERVFLNAANVAIVIGAAFGSLVLGKLKDITESLSPQVPIEITLMVLVLVAMSSGVIFLRHFANRQKAIVFAARKVIVLRRMLGMSYGRLQLVLPNWRVEGADEPFAIRLFPGWNTYVAFPCYAIAGISSIVVLFVSTFLIEELTSSFRIGLEISPLIVSGGITVAWFMNLCWLYRKALLDTHESSLLLFTQWMAKWLRLSIDNQAEYIIYRASLAVHELHRLELDLGYLKKMAVQVEDKEFYSHAGVSWRGLARMALYFVGFGPRSGGSTITQQLVRTLFIFDQKKLFRRKLVEILLAIWISSRVSKERQIEMYLASVRFEYGVLGVSAALRYFFADVVNNPSRAQSFFLIERLSNVRSRILGGKVKQTLSRLLSDEVISNKDVEEIVSIYRDMVDRGLIIDDARSEIKILENMSTTA